MYYIPMQELEKEINRLQTGEIDVLEYVLNQESLAELYLEEMLSKGITPTPQNAEEWLKQYENEYLYQ